MRTLLRVTFDTQAGNKTLADSSFQDNYEKNNGKPQLIGTLLP